MNKTSLLIVGIMLFLFSCKPDSNESIAIPIQFVDGYGDLKPGFGSFTGRPAGRNPWSKTNIDVKGIPEDWSDTSVECVWFDAKQFAYQNYKQGNLGDDFFKEVSTAWNIDTRVETFSENPLKCYVHVVSGHDRHGNLKYKIDTNNDHDFSDETAYSPANMSSKNADSLATASSEIVKYESFRNGQVVELEAPLLIVQDQNNILWSNIPQHGEAQFEGVKILVVSSGFLSTNYSPSSIFHDERRAEEVQQSEFIRLGEDIYQNLGVNTGRQQLMLKRIPRDSVVYSSQVGFNAKPFSGNDFLSQEEISLDSYKGKFLYVDFWGSWCGPCIAELPTLKDVYEDLDREKVEFLGIANDKAVPLRNMLENQNIRWKQILCEDGKGIIDDYNVLSYPTNFLIDPTGKIVAKNIRSEDLADSLNYYLPLTD